MLPTECVRTRSGQRLRRFCAFVDRDDPDLEVIPDLRDTVEAADVIALVRLESVELRERVRLSDDYCGPVTLFAATIVEAMKDVRSQRVNPFRFIMLDGRGLFEPGHDYIAILQWHPASRSYRVMSHSYVVPVRSGWVEWPSTDIYDIVTSGPVGEVLTGLRSLSRQR